MLQSPDINKFLESRMYRQKTYVIFLFKTIVVDHNSLLAGLTIVINTNARSNVYKLINKFRKTAKCGNREPTIIYEIKG